MTFRMHRAARQELADAMEHYEGEKRRLGRQLAGEVAAGIVEVVALPNVWQKIGPGLRLYRVRRFPYGLVYLVKNDEILFIAVTHLGREPGDWKNRL